MLHPRTQTVPMKKTLRGNELDMRVSPLTGKKLMELIYESVKASQSGGILKPLPDVLRISHKQFISMESDISQFRDTKFRFYFTDMNAMEVEVDENFDEVNVDHIIEEMGGEKEEGFESDD